MWTSPVPIPSRIPSTPWKTDTRTAGSGLPSSFFLHVHTAPSAQLRRRASPSTGASPPDAPFFVRLSTLARTEKGAQTGQARQKRKTRTRSVNAPPFLPLPFAQGRALSCGCTIFSRKRACRTVPFRLPPPGSPILPLRPRPSGLRPLSPRAKISFCPCPAAGTGAPARPRASASTVPAGDAVQTLPRIIP